MKDLVAMTNRCSRKYNNVLKEPAHKNFYCEPDPGCDVLLVRVRSPGDEVPLLVDQGALPGLGEAGQEEVEGGEGVAADPVPAEAGS